MPSRRRKAEAKNIGHITCPQCGGLSPVRRKSSGQFYYYCGHCGNNDSGLEGGQEYILAHANIWKEGIPPDNMPEWIKGHWRWKDPPKWLREGPEFKRVQENIQSPPVENPPTQDQGSITIQAPVLIQEEKNEVEPPATPVDQKPKGSKHSKTLSLPSKKKGGLFDGGLFS